MTRNDPSLAARVCLALVCEGPTHGWAIAALLAPGAELGRIWSLSRPLTYRALDQLVVDGLIERSGTEPGGGRIRTVLTSTPAGRGETAEWLDAPVSLPRDVRTELLLKMELRTRVGLPLAALAAVQRERFASVLDAVASGDEDFVALWRREHLLAIDRFLVALSEAPA